MDRELDDEEIERRLVDAPAERWDQLWRALAAFDAEAEHGVWAGGDTTTDPGTGRTVTYMPYVEYSDALRGVVAAVAGLGASAPFDWAAWPGTRRYAHGGDGLADAPVADAVRLVTAIQRSERFTEGSMLAAAEDGTLRAALARLEAWYRTPR